ncbi:hypothetical protein KGF54_000925 [Candida jiufengensis]|uniref:uncharacterized protein n=1 Tax=Candida jiufengensis TaxID=497108 RepID=UPI00222505C7|nr:uncharacterized protein KGF54_000925 [Candida jiufengensis]KAI5956450.1 hypothetical protein KGF54_000925 [Candida jiufengensis]
MSKVFDNTENERTKAPTKNSIVTQKFKRIPLGGKSTNTLNRSQSSLAPNKPLLVKSNSTIPIFTEPEEPQSQPQPEIRKRISPVPDLSPIKKQRINGFETDSLIKPEFAQKPSPQRKSPTPNLIHVNQVYQNYMDPIKRHSKPKNIDELVEKHWQDEIEYIPKQEVYFSTPIHSDSELNFDDGEVEDITEEIGLDLEDLKNLLD